MEEDQLRRIGAVKITAAAAVLVLAAHPASSESVEPRGSAYRPGFYRLATKAAFVGCVHVESVRSRLDGAGHEGLVRGAAPAFAARDGSASRRPRRPRRGRSGGARAGGPAPSGSCGASSRRSGSCPGPCRRRGREDLPRRSARPRGLPRRAPGALPARRPGPRKITSSWRSRKPRPKRSFTRSRSKVTGASQSKPSRVCSFSKPALASRILQGSSDHQQPRA